jgi:beta-phosphoglucomutase
MKQKRKSVKLRGEPNTKIRAVLLDLDGVLVNAPAWHREAFDKSLIAAGCRGLTDDEHETIYNGLSTIKKLELLNRNGLVPADKIPAINEMKQKLTIEIINKKCKPISRVIKVVFWLYRNGFKTGVVTNCSRHSAHLMLKLSGLIGCWHTCVTNNDVEGFIKPHPAPYRVGMRETCDWPELVLAVDDSHHGIESARAAGIKNIWHLKNFSDLTLRNMKNKLGVT